ncbi:MAG: ComF family protein [Acidobacteriia bacterium]|nr:ComF family protein [Terriglobia bacterium]
MSWIGSSLSLQWRGIREALAALVFPAPCRICGQMLDTGMRIPFCQVCIVGLMRTLPTPLCAQCGRPVVSVEESQGNGERHCHMCRRGAYSFDMARSYGAYTPAMARAVLMLKYESVIPLGAWFAGFLARVVDRNPGLFAADAVVPVPLDSSRQRERGYNQAELIARPLARLLGLPFRSYLLVRTRPRPNKLRLTRLERWETVRGAYATHQRAKVDKLRVLLVDDVFTTGATLDACAQALKQAGAARVVGLTVARALPQFGNPGAAPQ